MPKLYGELADWWPLVSAPADYAEEARAYRGLLARAGAKPPRTVLELGSGGGNVASYLKRDFQLTLVDLSDDMLRTSRAFNPECEHIRGDMRSVRLERTFDAVFVHDAIMYMTTEQDLGAAIATAAAHLPPGGGALFTPDCTLETFEPGTSHGGGDDPAGKRAVRYLEWTLPPASGTTVYEVHFAFILRYPDGTTGAVHDEHRFGLFPQATWLRLLEQHGFSARAKRLEFGGGVESSVAFVARKR